jgi:hypothetical protein
MPAFWLPATGQLDLPLQRFSPVLVPILHVALNDSHSPPNMYITVTPKCINLLHFPLHYLYFPYSFTLPGDVRALIVSLQKRTFLRVPL